MKKTPLLNSEISAVISKLGHFDTIVIADAGLPIPDNCKRIDLAITPNNPTFKSVLDAVLLEMKVGEYIIASEADSSFEIKCAESFNKVQNPTPKMKKVSHEEFKAMTKNAKAIIRTGECTPYNNIILSSDVAFFN